MRTPGGLPGPAAHLGLTASHRPRMGTDPVLERKERCRFRVALRADFSGKPEKSLLEQKFELFGGPGREPWRGAGRSPAKKILGKRVCVRPKSSVFKVQCGSKLSASPSSYTQGPGSPGATQCCPIHEIQYLYGAAQTHPSRFSIVMDPPNLLHGLSPSPLSSSSAVLSCFLKISGIHVAKRDFDIIVFLATFFAPAGRPRAAPLTARSAAYADGTVRSEQPKYCTFGLHQDDKKPL